MQHDDVTLLWGVQDCIMYMIWSTWLTARARDYFKIPKADWGGMLLDRDPSLLNL